jgi:hypothetical protein
MEPGILMVNHLISTTQRLQMDPISTSIQVSVHHLTSPGFSQRPNIMLAGIRIHKLIQSYPLIWKQSWHLRGAEPKNAFIFGTS